MDLRTVYLSLSIAYHFFGTKGRATTSQGRSGGGKGLVEVYSLVATLTGETCVTVDALNANVTPHTRNGVDGIEKRLCTKSHKKAFLAWVVFIDLGELPL